MNRRLRSTCRAPSKRDDGLHRYLKPGALARLRDSRISARSHRSDCHSQICFQRISSPSPSPVRSPLPDPFISGRIYGPRCSQRKRLVAANSVFFASLVSEAVDSPIVDVLGSDAIAAH